MRRATFFLLLNGLLSTGLGWNNNYDEPLFFLCPAFQSIHTIHSKHHNYYEDRIWDLGCKTTQEQSPHCFLSNFVNNFDKDVMFECPAQHVIAGMSSYHSDYHEDRRWMFYCCKSKCVSVNCQWTTYVNNFDEEFHWTVPPHSVLVGVKSYHQNYQEDRRWKYKYCVQQCSQN